jgi:hypothetical protein
MVEQVFCHKLTLSTGKVVLIREPKIKDQEMSAQLAGAKAGNDNNLSAAILWQKEMTKLLLLKINDKSLTANEKEDLDSLFSLREYSEVSMALRQLIGDVSGGKFQVELVPAGSQ